MPDRAAGASSAFDALRRDLDARGDLAGMDAFPRGAGPGHLPAGPRRLRRQPRAGAGGAAPTGRPTPAGSRRPNPLMFLQARRLVEAGVPVVTLAFGGWDHHSPPRGAADLHLAPPLLPAYDQALAALVNDLHQRGLSEDVAVVVWGEFGRTPRVSDRGGRDHWPPAGFVLFAGGGLRTGQVIGATDRRANGRRPGPSAPSRSWPRSTTSSASTRPPPCPTTRGGRFRCWTTGRRLRNWFRCESVTRNRRYAGALRRRPAALPAAR